MREKPVDLAVFMGVIYLHFSTLIMKIGTFFDAVLLARGQELFIFSSTSKDINVAKFAYFKMCSHVAVSLVSHAAELFKFIAYEIVAAFFSSRLWFLTYDRGNPEDERFFRYVIKLIVDSSA